MCKITRFSFEKSLRPIEYNDGLLNLPIYLAGVSDWWIEGYLAGE